MSEWDDKARFFRRTVRLSFFQSLWRFLISGCREWNSVEVEYIKVYPGDPRYDRAPYSARALYVNNP
jgi:hypothetical protein